MQNKINDIGIDYASVDEKQNLIIVDDHYTYNRENQKLRIKAVTEANEAFEAQNIEFEPYIIAPENLQKEEYAALSVFTAEERALLTGVLFPEGAEIASADSSAAEAQPEAEAGQPEETPTEQEPVSPLSVV